MPKRNYELESDYILDALEEEEDRLLQQLIDKLPEPLKFQFNKFIAVENKIESINIQNAFEKGIHIIDDKRAV